MDNQQPTNQDIVDNLNRSFSGLEQKMVTKDEIRDEFVKFEKRFGTRFVTKEFFVDKLDEKIADLRGDLVVLVRKEDKKLAATLDLLVGKHSITPEEAAGVLVLEPFSTNR